jgi:hypothetical protein
MMRLAILGGLALVVAASEAMAQGIVDPTKPPPGWMPVDPKAAAAQPKGKSPGGEEQASVPVSILLVGPTRRFALVRGEVVDNKSPGAKIVEVKRNDVVIQTERGRETLNLFPDVEKTPPRKRTGMGNKDKQ